MTDEAVELARYSWQDRSVLVVDGDEGMRRGLERMLGRHCGLVQAVADDGAPAGGGERGDGT
jgi:hypothetical protein